VVEKFLDDKDHFKVFEAPDRSRSSVDTQLYKRYISYERKQDDLVEYFIFEEKKKLGFSSPYLKINPFERLFKQFVEDLEDKYAHLPPSESHVRLIAHLEVKHALAIKLLAR